MFLFITDLHFCNITAPSFTYHLVATHSLQLLSLPLVVPQEVSKLTGVHVLVDLDEEPLAELEGLRELLRQLPHTLQELGEDGRYLLRVAIQLVTPEEVIYEIRKEERKDCMNDLTHTLTLLHTPVCKLVSKGDPVFLNQHLEEHEKREIKLNIKHRIKITQNKNKPDSHPTAQKF